MKRSGGYNFSWMKLIVLAAAFSMVFITVSLWGLKWIVEIQARSKAHTLAGEVLQSRSDIDAIVTRLTTLVHKAYQRSSSDPYVPMLMRARPYLSHRFLPAPFRIHPGAIDTIYLDGICDSAARTLTYLLNEAGFAAAQFNIYTPSSGGHSVVVAKTPGGRRLLLDPLFGLIPVEGGKILSPEQAKEHARKEKQPELIWRQLAPSGDSIAYDQTIYRQFASARFAQQGSRLDIEASIVIPDKESLHLGKADGSYEDVISAGNKENLSSFWHYIGSRYDRAWVRSLYFHQDTRMTIVLLESPNEKFFTTELPPTVIGRKLIYEIKAGETLRFIDGDAGYD